MATRMYVCESAEHPSSLLSGLNEQRLKGKLCDITVRVQGHLFKAHINVLAAAMGYFRDLFSKTMKEKTDDHVEIPMIVNSTGFAKILDFVYTSQLCLSQSTVMQVLCSACYLQIPYVVEKCQEFIGTHGHVTSASSLSEVTGPLLQDLQRQKQHSQSASLSFLSQLNRLSEKSLARIPIVETKRQSKSSPMEAQEPDEQQECELINTPPSPGNRSLTNGEDRSSPKINAPHQMNGDALKIKGVPHFKRERDAETSSNEDKQAVTVYSSQDRYSHPLGGADAKKFVFISNGQPMDVSVRETQSEIDHKSLAEYFSTSRDRERNAPATTENHLPNNTGLIPYHLHIDNPHEVNGIVPTNEQHMVTMAKTLSRERILENAQTQSFSLQPKKDKPKKEYGCDYCGKMFGRQQHLKRHILTHTGERPYPCQYCEKRFRRSEHLKHHLASHEQAMGIDSQLSRKRPRKTQQVADAYALSKMMLDRYNGHMEVDVNGNIAENGVISSTPVVLPSMFTDMERTQTSPQAKIMEVNGLNAPHSDINGSQISERNGHQESPSYMNHSPTAALNLSRSSPKEPLESDHHQVPSPTDHTSENSIGVDRVSGESKPAETEHSPRRSSSLSPVTKSYNGVFNENHPSSDIIGMEGSEVLTTDLKRLIAAMDE